VDDRAFFKRRALRLDREAKERLLRARGEGAVNRVIEQAIRDRACLSGTHVAFRVRFAPHALGRDENGRLSVIAFEYGGLTLGRAHWVCFAVDRLRGLRRTGDPWRSGPPESRPQFDLTEIEAAVDDSWSKNSAGAHGGENNRFAQGLVGSGQGKRVG
jgi:hypothetical protein